MDDEDPRPGGTDDGGDLLSRRTLVGGLAVGLTGAGVVYGASRLGSGADGGETTVDMRASDRTVTLAESGSGTVSVDLAGNPIAGAAGPAVTAYYWSDFQCPFCARFERETFPKLVENYVVPGTLQVVFLQLPYIGADSRTAARAAKCVWRQVHESAPDRYWDWHTRVFEEQGSERSGWASRENLLGITGEVEGIDAGAVGTCLDDDAEAVAASVAADRSLAETFGIGGTPGFVLRNTGSGAMGRITGAQPYERFESAIEQIREA